MLYVSVVLCDLKWGCIVYLPSSKGNVYNCSKARGSDADHSNCNTMLSTIPHIQHAFITAAVCTDQLMRWPALGCGEAVGGRCVAILKVFQEISPFVRPDMLISCMHACHVF